MRLILRRIASPVKMPDAVTTACTLNLLGRVVQLSVGNEAPDVWRWRMQLDYAKHPVAEGVTGTKIAAQVESQLAVEGWLRQWHKSDAIGRYIWIEQDIQSNGIQPV